MEKIVLVAEKRKDTGKGIARSLRRQGMLPAVLYGGGSATSIKLHKKDIAKLINSVAGEHALITLRVQDKDTTTDHWAIIKDYQTGPVVSELLHVDFMEVSLDKKIQVTVPVILTAEPMGIKKGGILQHRLREVEVECLPTQIPEHIAVDASSIDIGGSIHVSDLAVREGIKILAEPAKVVLTVTAPVVEEVPAPAAPVGEIKEPELIKKAKKEEEIKEEK
ncbi:MAG TPA: 50S ribosomal protein L25 [Nitrospiraceae bacterium]|nr:50S ribosomal protein L25 [Nitrospiraceae bacterium]